MKNRFARILSLVLAGGILTGCATFGETRDTSPAASPGTSNPPTITDREERPQGL